MKNLIDKIKKLRKNKNMTLKDVSEKLNVSLTAYNQIELGNTSLSLERVYQFADIFNVSVAELLDIDNNNVVAVDNEHQIEELKKENEELKNENEKLNLRIENLEYKIKLISLTAELKSLKIPKKDDNL